MQLVVDPSGQLLCLYDERIDLAAFGRLTIARAGRVDPDGKGRWTADLGPAGGPVLGPFRLRSEALRAEAAWLEAHRLAPGEPPGDGHRPAE